MSLTPSQRWLRRSSGFLRVIASSIGGLSVRHTRRIPIWRGSTRLSQSVPTRLHATRQCREEPDAGLEVAVARAARRLDVGSDRSARLRPNQASQPSDPAAGAVRARRRRRRGGARRRPEAQRADRPAGAGGIEARRGRRARGQRVDARRRRTARRCWPRPARTPRCRCCRSSPGIRATTSPRSPTSTRRCS